MQGLNRVTMDGETVLIQVEGELVDAAALSWAYDVAEDIVPKANASLGFSINHNPDNPVSRVCEVMGFPGDAHEHPLRERGDDNRRVCNAVLKRYGQFAPDC